MTRTQEHSRHLGVTAGATALILAVTLALSAVFAQGSRSLAMVTTGEALHASEQLMSGATAERGAVAVAVLIADAHERGVATDAQLSLALDDVSAATTDLRLRAAHLASLDVATAQTIEPLAEIAAQSGDELAESLAGGEVDAAGITAERALLPALQALETAVNTHREEAMSYLEAEKGAAGALARAASIAVALLVPLAAYVAYKRLQKRREHRAAVGRELARQRDELRIKDEMLASLSHELRTPLTGIYGMAAAMQDEGHHDPAFQAEMTGIILSEAADLARMVDDLLVAARADTDTLGIVMEPTELDHAVEQELEPFRRHTTIEMETDPAAVMADRLRLRHAVRNLVANAITHGGASISVRGAADEGRYRLDIADDGPGLDAEAQTHLFERFTHPGTTALTKGSVGLGLYVAHALVEAMSGTLSYIRDDGTTIFRIDLALAPREPQTLGRRMTIDDVFPDRSRDPAAAIPSERQ